MEKWIHQVNRLSSYFGGVLVLAMVLVILQDVVRRYLFNDPTTWSTDLSRFLLTYIVFLGLAPALEKGNHVAVDVIINQFNDRWQWILRLVGYVLVVFFGCVLFVELTRVTAEAFADNRLSPTSFPIPLKWVYLIGPVGACLFTWNAVLILMRHWKKRNGTDRGEGREM